MGGDGDDRIAATDRVRECRQSPAGANRGSRAGTGGACGTRGRARPDRAGTVHREHRAGTNRRNSRGGVRDRGGETGGEYESRAAAAAGADLRGFDGSAVYAGGFDCGRNRVWCDPCLEEWRRACDRCVARGRS